MNTLTKMFSLCLCLGALVFAAPDAKLDGDTNKQNPVKMKETFLRGPSLDYEPSSRDCGETFVAFGVDPNGSYETCWDDGSGYFYFYWEGGCLALDITYSGGTLDLSAYGFTEGFYFYGFDPGATENFIMTFDDGSTGEGSATNECATCEDLGQITCWDGSCADTEADCPEEGDCGDGFVIDCVDTDCCPESWIGDGYEDCEDQAYGCDLTCYDNDGGDCGETESCEDQGLITCWDGSCAASEADCPEEGDCGAGLVEDCDGSGECYSESWIGDGLCDGNSQEWGANLCCYDNDGGDCTDAECSNCEDDGLVECWDGSCATSSDDCPDQPEIETPGICAEGVDYSGYNAVLVTWSIETVCGDGICNGDEDYYNCPEDCNAPGECDDGFVPDCVDDDCCPESWIGDGFEDCEDQAYGCDLTCYDNDGGDCDGGGGSEGCNDCVNDFTNYGSECCDSAWEEYGIDCATLESEYYWDCSGCNCPGDGPAECGDGNCTGDEDYYNCPEDCNAPGECDDGFVTDCVDDDCCPESWIGDGFEDCEDQAYGCDLTCYDNDGGDCGGRTTATAPKSNMPQSITDTMEIIRKGAPYSRENVASASTHEGQNQSPSSRELALSLTFECEACLEGEAFTGTWDADPSFGEFTLYGFDDFSVVTVTAQACDNGACGDVVGPVVAVAGAADGVQDCAEGAGGDPCDGTLSGDATLDGEVNVLDIVQVVNHILESSLLTDECALGAADYTDDGEVNVLDIVQIVSVILEGRITGDATSAILKNENGQMTIDANGYIGGVQMTLSHGADFSIEVTDRALVADYNTMGNTTKLVIVAPETDELFSSVGSYTIDEMIVANSTSEVSVSMPSNIEIVGAYPNPFNPSTTVSVSVDNVTAATIMAYDISGRSVGVVFDGVLEAGMSSITWNASSLPSGAYILKLSTPDGSASMQKVMLMK